MKQFFNIMMLICGVSILGGCTGVPYYKEASFNSPHALVQFEKAEGPVSAVFGGMKVVPLEINGRPPNEWNKWSFREFKVHPGKVSILVKVYISSSLEAFGYVKFEASNGEVYKVSRILREENIEIIVTNSSGEKLSSVTARKQPVNSQPYYVPLYIPAR